MTEPLKLSGNMVAIDIVDGDAVANNDGDAGVRESVRSFCTNICNDEGARSYSGYEIAAILDALAMRLRHDAQQFATGGDDPLDLFAKLDNAADDLDGVSAIYNDLIF